MGVRLIAEVLDHAPDDLTPAELVVLMVLAENANDATREGWPGLDFIARRARIYPGTLRKMFARWRERTPSIDIRVPIGVGRDGRPVYAAKGHRTVYRFPVLAKGVPPQHANTSEGVPPEGASGGTPLTAKGVPPEGAFEDQRRAVGAAKGVPLEPQRRAATAHPSPQEPSLEPSKDRNTVPPPADASALDAEQPSSKAEDRPAFEAFWSAYPRKIDKGHGRKAWTAMIKKGADPASIIFGAKIYADYVVTARTEPRFIPHPATWLNGERWGDQLPAATKNGTKTYLNPPNQDEYDDWSKL